VVGGGGERGREGGRRVVEGEWWKKSGRRRVMEGEW
jgi:hypothetical protein